MNVAKLSPAEPDPSLSQHNASRLSKISMSQNTLETL